MLNSRMMCAAAAVLGLACGGPAQDAGADGELRGVTPFPVPQYPARCGVALIDSFETDAQVASWHASSWAEATLDAAGNPLPVSRVAAGATAGSSALSIGVRFTGAGYQQGYVGREGLALSLAGCATLALDVTLPAGAPAGLSGALVLLLGPGSAWNGQADRVALAPGATTTVRLPLAGAIEPVPARDLLKQLQGVGLKIDGASVNYSGAISLDNLRVEPLAPPAAEDTQAYPVGTYGGFIGAGGTNIPARNGFLTFTADSTVQGHALRWPKLGAAGGDFVLGSASFGGTGAAANGPSLVFHDWTTLEARQDIPGFGTASALLSRAFPAARYLSDATTFDWSTGDSTRAPMSRMAVVINGQINVIPLDSQPNVDLSGMSEPWILLWAGGASGWSFDAPTLFTLERRPQAAAQGASGLELSFSGPLGSVNVMPLGGLRRRDLAETAGWDSGLPGDVIVQSRALVQPLAAFPVGLVETSTVNEAAGTVMVTDTYRFQTTQDDWGTVPAQVAAISPAVYFAGKNGYAVTYPAGAPIETPVATWFGPYAYQPGAIATYTLPLPAGLKRLPVALRVSNSAATKPIRAELERIIDQEVPTEPGTYWLGNDESDADFLCDAWPTLLPGSAVREKARVTGARLAENPFLSRSIDTFTEPVTGQHYLVPTWYPEANLPFDKEWNIGRQLSSAARCSEALDLDLARGLWPKLLASYRYDRIFFDWATGSVLSSTLGINELSDGIHFAWDGMLGVGRLARKLGDEQTWRDVAYRSARQQAALYHAWVQSQWVKDIDYGIGHISDAKLPADQVETRGAIDGYVEEFGCATLELKSFWQTTNYLYFDIPAQLSLYRDTGLEARVHALEYDLMPSFHPSWADGNATDPVDNRYYGSNYTAAHLAARALLFHDDPAQLFTLYNSARGTLAAGQWYTMFFHGLAGPTLLSIERAKAPVVEAPVGQIHLVASSYDAVSGKVTLDYQALSNGAANVRTRKPGGSWKNHAIVLKAGVRSVVSFLP